jgi:hypothetical protein
VDAFYLPFPAFVVTSPGLVPWELNRPDVGRVFPIYTDRDLAELAIDAADAEGFLPNQIGSASTLRGMLRNLKKQGFTHVAIDPSDEWLPTWTIDDALDSLQGR